MKLLDSGGTANGGVNASAIQTFQIVVNKPLKWHNTLHGLDVTGAGGVIDNQVAPGDALAIINFINAFGSGHVPANAVYGPPYYDTNADDSISPGDALAVINFINAFGSSLPGPAGEGEALSNSCDAYFQQLGQPPQPVTVNASGQPQSNDPLAETIAILAGDAASEQIRRKRGFLQ